MSGSAGVIALVLAETVAGASVFLWLTPLWGEVKRGFFKLVSSIVLVAAAAGWLSTRAAQVAGDRAGVWAVRLTFGAAAVVLLTTILLFARRATVARAVGLASVAVSASALVPMVQAARQAPGIALFQVLAGAAFLGSVSGGLLLGHWYLTDRGLSRAPIARATTIMLVGIGLEAVGVVSSGFGGMPHANPALNPLLTAGALAPWIALGMVGTTALIAALVKASLRGQRASAVQSATGFFYLAVVTAFTAEVAVKTRFLPG